MRTFPLLGANLRKSVYTSETWDQQRKMLEPQNGVDVEANR